MNNPYYNPEAFDLKILTVHDFSDGNYCFDYRVIWIHKKTRRIYTARDSGCSCPTPFEDYTLEDLEIANFAELINEARAAQREYSYGGDDIPDYVTKLRRLKNYYVD